MKYLGKFDVRFITYVKQKHGIHFKDFDDYANHLYYAKCFKNDELYYEALEEDVRGFVKWQEEQMKKW